MLHVVSFRLLTIKLYLKLIVIIILPKIDCFHLEQRHTLFHRVQDTQFLFICVQGSTCVIIVNGINQEVKMQTHLGPGNKTTGQYNILGRRLMFRQKRKIAGPNLARNFHSYFIHKFMTFKLKISHTLCALSMSWILASALKILQNLKDILSWLFSNDNGSTCTSNKS